MTAMGAAAALLVYAGLAGAAGVALAAAGAHGNGNEALTTPAYLLVMHAAAAVAIVAVGMRAGYPAGFLIAALIVLIGATLFSGDIAARTLWGTRLFPMAAPTGGTTMILGWLMLAGAAVWELLSHRG
jgi:uncharacterized membrane protein YgdD (TMEM256/DUF423 family)